MGAGCAPLEPPPPPHAASALLANRIAANRPVFIWKPSPQVMGLQRIGWRIVKQDRIRKRFKIKNTVSVRADPGSYPATICVEKRAFHWRIPVPGDSVGIMFEGGRRKGWRSAWRSTGVILSGGLLSACGSGVDYRPVADTPVRIGKPYTIRGTTHVPRAQPNYDVLGYASWYGNESGNQTANGERFRPGWVTAAHTTLPLPTYVEVTALSTGRTILVRVNDRGPFSRGRILDLSRGAAEALGIRSSGVAAVRVRAVEPSARDARRLREGKAAAERPRVEGRVLDRLRGQFATGLRDGAIAAQ